MTLFQRFVGELSHDTRLDWVAAVVDPGTLTEPITMPEMHWDWAPGEALKPYNCTVADN